MVDCKYWLEDNGVEHSGCVQYYDMCMKPPYGVHCSDRFCWRKIFLKIKEWLWK